MLTKILQKFAPDAKFTKIWSNKRIRAIILLLLWFIIIGVVYAIVIAPYDEVDYKTPSNNVSENSVTYENLKNKLLENNFSFKYTFTEDNIKTIYNGEVKDSEKVIYIENADGIKEYYLNSLEIYKVSLGQLVETSDLDLPEYFDLNYVFSLVDGIEPNETEKDFIFQNSDIYVKMSIENDNFSFIEIELNNNSYIYEFNNVGKIESISY